MKFLVLPPTFFVAMAHEMTREDAVAFLSAGTRTGKLATTRDDGRPHVVPIWFVIDGTDVVFNTGEASVKTANLRRDPRASMVVDLEEPPYAYVKVDGVATIDDDLEDVRRFATIIGGRYMGAHRAEEFGRRNGVPGEVLVRLSIDRLTARDDIAG